MQSFLKNRKKIGYSLLFLFTMVLFSSAFQNCVRPTGLSASSSSAQIMNRSISSSVINNSDNSVISDFGAQSESSGFPVTGRGASTGSVLPQVNNSNLAAPIALNTNSIFQSCVISNGVGSQNKIGSNWGACIPISCDTNFHKNGIFCTSNNVTFEVGIAQSDLLWHINDPEYPSRAMITDMGNIGISSLRTNLRGISNATLFSELVLQANKNKMNVVVTILQDEEDYLKPADSYGNNNTDFKKTCGWAGGSLKLSLIDINRYKIRLQAHLDALKLIGASVTAFEIGNELDWFCFNGDLPASKNIKANDPTLIGFSIKYAQLLQTSKELIKLKFPDAIVLTYGAASCSLFAEKGCLIDPAKLLAQNEIIKKADAVAIHMYPFTSDHKAEVLNEINTYSQLIGAKKIWITESGFTPEKGDTKILFTDLIDILKSSGVVSQFFGYTFYSKAGGESFSLSSGLGGTLNSAIQLFTTKPFVITAPATACKITLQSCPAHPEWTDAKGTFLDISNVNNSNSNQVACLQRASDFSGSCQSVSTVTAGYYVNNLLVSERSVEPVSICKISLVDCPVHPEWKLSGVFRDDANPNNSNGNQTACLNRAQDYFNACKPSSGAVSATYFESGVILGRKSVDRVQ